MDYFVNNETHRTQRKCISNVEISNVQWFNIYNQPTNQTDRQTDSQPKTRGVYAWDDAVSQECSSAIINMINDS